jgi:hypothetical protein
MADELDQLLRERFDLSRDDVVAALKTLPVLRPWATTLTDEQARLLDEVGFTEDADAYAAAAVDTAAHMGRLTSTAYTAAEVATGLGVGQSRVRQRRLSGALWAIEDGGSYVFPQLQFERDAKGRPTRQIRGLDQVLRALPHDLHPVAIAGFLHTPQPDLQVNGKLVAPLEWLRSGGDVGSVVTVAEAAEWVGR